MSRTFLFALSERFRYPRKSIREESLRNPGCPGKSKKPGSALFPCVSMEIHLHGRKGSPGGKMGGG